MVDASDLLLKHHVGKEPLGVKPHVIIQIQKQPLSNEDLVVIFLTGVELRGSAIVNFFVDALSMGMVVHQLQVLLLLHEAFGHENVRLLNHMESNVLL